MRKILIIEKKKNHGCIFLDSQIEFLEFLIFHRQKYFLSEFVSDHFNWIIYSFFCIESKRYFSGENEDPIWIYTLLVSKPLYAGYKHLIYQVHYQ